MSLILFDVSRLAATYGAFLLKQDNTPQKPDIFFDFRTFRRCAHSALAISTCLLVGISFDVRAQIYLPDGTPGSDGHATTSTCTAAVGSSITVGRTTTHGTTSNPAGSTGTYANIIGCNADGGGFLAATALGSFASITGTGGAAFGHLATAGQWGTAIGLEAAATGIASTALGYGTSASGINSVAIGGSSNTAGTGSTALADSTTAAGDGAIAIGNNAIRGAKALGINSIALGGQTVVLAGASSGIAMGVGSTVNGNDSIAFGHSATAGVADGSVIQSVAMGTLSSATGNRSLALGSLANVSAANSVALGSNSLASGTTLANAAYGVGGAASGGEVNIANGANGRRLTGLAAGANATDAVNVTQLNLSGQNTAAALGGGASLNATTGVWAAPSYASNSISTTGANTGPVSNSNVGAALGALNTGLTNTAAVAVKYDAAGGDKITLGATGGSGAGSPVTISNVAAGTLTAVSSEAVNGSQLNTTNAQVAANASNIAGNTSAITALADGDGIKFFHSSSALADSTAGGVDSVAIGPVATATAVNSVAIGNGANSASADSIALGSNASATGTTLTTAAYGVGGSASGGEVNIANGANGRRITGLAAGANTTDAVNVSQLNLAGQNAAAAFGGGAALDATTGVWVAPSYSVNGISASGANTGPINSNNIGSALGTLNTGLTNNAAVAVKYDDVATKDLVTFNQGGAATRLGNVAAGTLNAISTEAVNGSQLFSTNQQVDNLLNGTTGTKYFHTNSTLGDSTASGIDSISIGPVAVSTTTNSVAIGNGASSTSASSVALGANSSATGSTLATGAYGVGGSASGGEVNVANGANGRRLTGVAAGANSTDAVNVSQLNLLGQNTASALGGGATLDAVTGAWAAPRYSINSIDAAGTDSGPVISNNVGAALSTLSTGLANTAAVAVKYDSSVAKDLVTFNPGGEATRLSNVAPGNLSAISTEAVNGSQLFSTNQQVNSLLNGTTGTKYFHTNSTLGDSTASGVDSIAVGPLAISGGNVSIAIGKNSVASSDSSIAIGDSALALGGKAVSIGSGNIATGDGAVAIGDPNTATGRGAVTMGADNAANGQGAVALGSDNSATGLGSVALGNASVASATGSMALGSSANASAASALAFGSNANASSANSIALGANSSATGVTLTTAAYGIGGAASGGEVNIANGANSRRITGLAAGANATDAINVSQLNLAGQNAASALGGGAALDASTGAWVAPSYSVNGVSVSGANTGPITSNNIGSALGTLNTGLTNTAAVAVKYDNVATKDLVTFNQGGTATQLSNVAAGTLSAISTEAVNGSQLFSTNQQVDNLLNGTTGAKYFHANSTLADSSASGQDSVAIGPLAVASAANTFSAGSNASATMIGSVAIGNLSQAQVQGSVALGEGSLSDRVLAPSTGTIPVGSGIIRYDTSDATLLGAVSLGRTGAYRQLTNVADATDAQDAVTLRQLTGALSSLSSTGALYFHANSANPNDALATGQESIAVGPGTVVNADSGIGLGDQASVSQTAPGGIAIGRVSQVLLASGIAIGSEAKAQGEQSVALGAGANATFASSIALGSSSVTIVGAQTNYNAYRLAAAQSSVGELGVGTALGNRKITGVGAGSQNNDAVNVEQLTAVGLQVDQNTLGITGLDGRVTTIENTIGQIGSGGGIKYLHTNSTKADSVATGANAMALGPNAQAAGSESTAVGNDASATGTSAVAIGTGATATADGSVAIGKGATDGGRGAETYSGKYSGATNTTSGTVSVGNAATNETRTVSNVADGQNATDAVNVRQLDGAVTESKEYTDDTIKNINAVVGNVDGRITTVEGDVTNIKTGSDGVFQVNHAITQNKPQASGTDAVAGGNGAVASGNNSAAIGTRSQATGESSVALGNGAKASAKGATALGANSVADRDNSVSVGSTGNERQITNVAAATHDTDAVNFDQLNKSVSSITGNANAYTDQRYSELKHDLKAQDDLLSAGIAGAMAMSSLPQPYSAGASMASASVGNYHGQSSLAVGISRISDNGHWVSKLQGNTDTQGQLGVAVGVGYQW